MSGSMHIDSEQFAKHFSGLSWPHHGWEDIKEDMLLDMLELQAEMGRSPGAALFLLIDRAHGAQ